MYQEKQYSRREALKKIGYFGAAAAGLTSLLNCSKKESSSDSLEKSVEDGPDLSTPEKAIKNYFNQFKKFKQGDDWNSNLETIQPYVSNSYYQGMKRMIEKDRDIYIEPLPKGIQIKIIKVDYLSKTKAQVLIEATLDGEKGKSTTSVVLENNVWVVDSPPQD